MSREVEVKNIKMTASVQEDLQISLGQLADLKAAGVNPTASEIAAGRSTYTGLQGNQGSEANDDELYMAARAAIIYTTTGDNPTTDSSNLLRIRKDSFTSTTSINNFMYTTNSSGDAVASVANYVPTYGDAAEYAGAAFLTVPGRVESTTAKYGTAVKAVVRVWLEGEDPNCWNPNAGQDFNISLKFVKGAIGDTTTVANNATAELSAMLTERHIINNVTGEVTGVEYKQVDIDDYLKEVKLYGGSTTTPLVKKSSSDDQKYVYYEEISAANVDERVFTVSSYFEVLTGSSFHDYANYKVMLEVRLLTQGGATISNSTQKDHIVYTNAKIYTEVIQD